MRQACDHPYLALPNSDGSPSSRRGGGKQSPGFSAETMHGILKGLLLAQGILLPGESAGDAMLRRQLEQATQSQSQSDSMGAGAPVAPAPSTSEHASGRVTVRDLAR